MNDQKIENLIFECITALRNFLKSNHTSAELCDHVKKQLEAINRIVPRHAKKVFDYIEDGAPFKELFAASSLQNEYWVMVLSKWPIDTLDEYYKKNDARSYLKSFETAWFTYKLTKQEPRKWWFDTLDIFLHYQVGYTSFNRLYVLARDKSEADRTVFDYGNFKPFGGNWESRGVEGTRTKEAEKEILKHFPIPKFIKNAVKKPQDHDDVTTDYIAEVLQSINGLPPKKALEMLCEGNLRSNVNIRAIDRWKDRIDGSKALKTKKRNGIFKTDSLDTRGRSEDSELVQVVYVDEDGRPTDESIERKIINQNIREWGFSQFPEDSTNYRIMETLFENPSFSSKQIGEKLNIPASTIKKARQRIRSSLKQSPKLF